MDQSLEKQFNTILSPEESPRKLLTRLQIENNPHQLFVSYLMDHIAESDLIIPMLPDVGLKLIQVTMGESYDFHSVARLISSDPILSLNLLKFANSPLYRGAYPIHEIDQAIARVGVKEVTSLAISLYLKSRFIAPEITRIITRPLWKQAILAAIISEQLGKKYLIPHSILYTLGLLHNVGALVVLMNTEYFQKKHSDFHPDQQLLHKAIGTFQNRLSALVLYRWEFEAEVIDPILKRSLPINPNTPLQRQILYFATHFAHSIFSGTLKSLGQNQLKEFYHFLTLKSGLKLSGDEQMAVINKSLTLYQETIQLFQ